MSDKAEDDDTALNLSLSPQSDDIPAEGDTESIEDDTDTSAESDNDTDYSAMTVAELRNLAKSRGLSGYSTLNKDELIALLSSQ
ncbi:MAG: Rho termination factor N-terminal domain-containing protein [Oscillospiraceae bacterium]|nr:Rho termination factor N-terminal domain-containing protein [Oscillospiraceae bacterium]